MKFCVARTFLVERHLDVVLEVLQVVGSKFLFYKICWDLPLEDSQKKLRWLLHKWGRYLTFWTLEKRKEKKTRTSRSYKVSNWDILEFRSQFEIRTFIFLITLDYGTLINKEIESISNNFDVLCWNSPRCCPRSSPDGWIRFLFYKTCRKISQEDSVKKLGWLIYKWRRY